MIRRSFLTVLAVAFATASVAAAKPNFTGEWKLNVQKSEFGPIPPPTSSTLKIAHADPDLKMSVKQSGEQGDMEFEATYSTDGKETSNTIGPMQTKSTAVWEADVLAVNTKLDAGGTEVKFSQKWTLSEDGKTMKHATHIATAQGEFDMVSVYDKTN